ncbi:hypothetical protein BDV25DRAFT_129106 [Aspergillus avenaceus]|uniref:Peroxin/Ferlin domain-containing protein n=1 Tax=Aspergillus avenaceus TaxID=36643 RepID=A0A5N6TXA1_ASPAV|nr:hypothetical protein BDV25DRAFT_129106 [Aspergillus avenaceus]
MEEPPSLHLIDNTAPNRRLSEDEALSEATTSDDLSRNTSRRWRKPSVRRQLTKRKYRKWQPHRLGITDTDEDRRPSDARLSTTDTNTNTIGDGSLTETDSLAATEHRDTNVSEQTNDGQQPGSGLRITGLHPGSHLDILYENQRGWFFFGIPLYSHGSLLNFDPAAWVTHDLRDSPVNITNAQVPDPSWEWAWRTWYVDMSGDVDDQGWQYSFSFSSSAWHGSHPWFHSFVRRRRWVRLRVKKASEQGRRGRSDFEMAHMLNEDYFTIHSGKKKRASSAGPGSQGPSTRLSRATTTVEEHLPLEEIGNIPTLMYALKMAIVDREKLDTLKRFIDDGGQELYYLDGKIPDIMSLFVFQASRWQLLVYLTNVVDELSEELSKTTGADAEELRRKRDHLSKSIDTAKHHLTGPEILAPEGREPAPEMSEMLDLTPATKKDNLLSRYPSTLSRKPVDNGGEIKGIPQAAEIGREGHIYHILSVSVLMLSRGRPCLKRRVQTTVLNTVAAGAEEPLLFLYPRWFTASITQRRLASSIYTASTRIHSASKYARGAHGRFLFESPKRWTSSDRTVETAVPETSQEHDEPTTTLEDEPFQYEERSPGEGQRDGSIQPTYITLKASGGKTHTRPLAPRFRNPHRQRGMLDLWKLSVRDRRKLRSRIWHIEPGSGSNVELLHWIRMKRLIEKLEQTTIVWKKRGVKSRTYLLPEETVGLLAGVTDMSLRENIWYVPLHNGCKVHVLHPRDSEGQYRKVRVTGDSDRVVEIVGDRLKKTRMLQKRGDPLIDIRLPLVPIFPSKHTMVQRNMEVPVIRGVWDTHDKYPAPLDTLLALSEDISSVREFAEHVEELTYSEPTSQDFQDHGMHHRQRYYGFLSTAALNQALAYVFHHGFFQSARQLLLVAEHVATTETFNIALKHLAKRQNLLAFRMIILMMRRLDIRPNSQTWLSFLDCLISPEAKEQLIEVVMKKGYLHDTSSMRTALQLTVQNTFFAHLERGESVDSFFSMLANTYGANWFPASLTSQMLSVTVRTKNIPAMERLLEIRKQQGFAQSSSMITQIATMFRKDIFSVLRYMFKYITLPESKIQPRTWEMLFFIAYKGRHYNLCRTTNKMTQTMRATLACNVSFRKGKYFEEAWSMSAGKVLVGVDVHLKAGNFHKSLLDLVPTEFHLNPVASLVTGYKPAGEERRKQQQLVAKVIEHDMTEGPNYRPTLPLGIMLETAAALDQEWRWKPRPTHWLMQNAIQVPIEPIGSL